MITFSLYPIPNDVFVGVGEIPLQHYLGYLDSIRKFTLDSAIQYTQKIYGIDITVALSSSKFLWETSNDTYKDFERDNHKNKKDDGSRSYFDSVGRNRFMKFKTTHWARNQDMLTSSFENAEEVHHIFPLAYGGDSSLTNLIHISKYNHDILHQNPLQDNEKYANQAVDYLAMFYMDWMADRVFRKNDLYRYFSDGTGILCSEFYFSSVKLELDSFYKKIVQYERKNSCRTNHDMNKNHLKDFQRQEVIQ